MVTCGREKSGGSSSSWHGGTVSGDKLAGAWKINIYDCLSQEDDEPSTPAVPDVESNKAGDGPSNAEQDEPSQVNSSSRVEQLSSQAEQSPCRAKQGRGRAHY